MYRTNELEELNDRLSDVASAIAARDRAATRLATLRMHRDEILSRIAELERVWGDELRDVRRLERTSLAALFYAMLGTKERRLEKERRELLAAELRLTEARDELAVVDAQIKELDDRLRGWSDLDVRMTELLQQKERWLHLNDDEASLRLMNLADEIASISSKCVELDEAIQAGVAANVMLANIVVALDHATNWGTWDTWGGGGMFSSMAKHDHIDTARSIIPQAQEALRTFAKEYGDVGGEFTMSVQIGAFGRFADTFFDNLITDWSVQSQLGDTRAQVTQVRWALDDCLQRVHAERHRLQRRVEEKSRERNRILHT